MPKVSPEHKERRRREILDGARACFARHGYEGATVARLEEATGLSRGAIFNYFPNKEAIFIELAAETSERAVSVWLEHGFRALLDEIVAEDPDWLAVQLEAVRRYRTDPSFRKQVREREERYVATRGERMERLRAQGVREDLPLEAVAIFLGIVANGLALRLTTDDPLPDLDVLAELVATGVAPTRTRKKAGAWKSAPRTRRTRRSSRPSSAG